MRFIAAATLMLLITGSSALPSELPVRGRLVSPPKHIPVGVSAPRTRAAPPTTSGSGPSSPASLESAPAPDAEPPLLERFGPFLRSQLELLFTGSVQAPKCGESRSRNADPACKQHVSARRFRRHTSRRHTVR